MSNHTVLVSGAGIAGPTLAYWLRLAGFQPTLVERSPILRSGGYVVDFWGLGYDIAGRMGLLEDINRVGYHVREMRIVDDRGRRVTGFGTKVFEELTEGRYVTLARSDLSRLLFEKTEGAVEVIFGDEIVGLRQREDAVEFVSGTPVRGEFDLVIGADGMHSAVRRLAFGRSICLKRNSATQSRPSRLAATSRATRMCVSDVRLPGQMLDALLLHQDALAVPVVFPTKAVRCRRLPTCKRPCCASDIASENGNARPSWTISIERISFISIASARSG